MHDSNRDTKKFVDKLYSQLPSFTDVFDEDTWYMFTGSIVAAVCVLAFLMSRIVTIKPAD